MGCCFSNPDDKEVTSAYPVQIYSIPAQPQPYPSSGQAYIAQPYIQQQYATQTYGQQYYPTQPVYQQQYPTQSYPVPSAPYISPPPPPPVYYPPSSIVNNV